MTQEWLNDHEAVMLAEQHIQARGAGMMCEKQDIEIKRLREALGELLSATGDAFCGAPRGGKILCDQMRPEDKDRFWDAVNGAADLLRQP